MASVTTIVVDDTDSGIQYSDGGWISDEQNSIAAGVGPVGDPLYGTLHGAISSSSSFSYQFNGSFRGSIIVLGTYTRVPASWTCTLDGTLIGNFSSVWDGLPHQTNRQTACYTNTLNLQSGRHELRVSVNGTKDSPIWFDFISFNPSLGADTPAFGDVQVDWSSSQLNYGEGWWGDLDNRQLGVTGYKFGATMEFDFIGHSITWVGYANSSNFDDSIKGSYSVDGEAPIDFSYTKPTINLVNNAQHIDNQVFFQTRKYSDGHHHVQVINQGSATPLSLLNIIVQNSTSDFTLSPVPPIQSLTSTTASTAPSSSPPSSLGNHQERARPLGSIIGGCVGALGVILCIICLYLFRRARRRSRAQHDLAGAHQYNYGLPGTQDDEKGPQELQGPAMIDPSHNSRPLAPFEPITLPNASGEQAEQPQQREMIMVHEDSGVRYANTFEELENTETDNPPQSVLCAYVLEVSSI